jgi:hypothetical protein
VAGPAASDRPVTTATTEAKDKVDALIRNDFRIAKGGLLPQWVWKIGGYCHHL